MNNYIFTFLGLSLTELNLFITDLVIFCVAYYCYSNLKTKNRSEINVSGYSFFFLFTAISAMVSGFGHLLTLYTYEYLKMCGWVFSLLANFYIIKASEQHILNINTRKILNIINPLKFTLSLIALLLVQKFAIVSVDTILSIACVALPIHTLQWKKTAKNGYKVFCVGIVFTMLTGIVSYLQLSISDTW